MEGEKVSVLTAKKVDVFDVRILDKAEQVCVWGGYTRREGPHGGEPVKIRFYSCRLKYISMFVENSNENSPSKVLNMKTLKKTANPTFILRGSGILDLYINLDIKICYR